MTLEEAMATADKPIIHLASVYPFYECGKEHRRGDFFVLDRANSTCPKCNAKFDCIKEKEKAPCH